jgi:cold shock CspA family protein
MEKQPVKRYDSVGGGIGSTTSAENDQDIFFCVKPVEEGGPVIKPGQKVTYELMLGSDGHYYAINLQLIDDDE